MAITLTATVGSEDANSFVTLDEAHAYFDAQPDSERWWRLAGSLEQQRALIEAAAEFNRKKWRGLRVDEIQALAWPRRYVPVPDGFGYFAVDEIPQQIKDAQCERALDFLENGIAGSEGGDGVTSFTGSGIALQYGSPGSSITQSRTEKLLAPFLLDSSVARA